MWPNSAQLVEDFFHIDGYKQSSLPTREGHKVKKVGRASKKINRHFRAATLLKKHKIFDKRCKDR